MLARIQVHFIKKLLWIDKTGSWTGLENCAFPHFQTIEEVIALRYPKGWEPNEMFLVGDMAFIYGSGSDIGDITIIWLEE